MIHYQKLIVYGVALCASILDKIRKLGLGSRRAECVEQVRECPREDALDAHDLVARQQQVGQRVEHGQPSSNRPLVQAHGS